MINSSFIVSGNKRLVNTLEIEFSVKMKIDFMVNLALANRNILIKINILIYFFKN